MTNYDELKKVAEVLLLTSDRGYNAALYKYRSLSRPSDILALLAEREKLLKVVEAAKKSVLFGYPRSGLDDALKELDK